MKIEVCMPGKISDKPYQKLIDQYLERCNGRLSVDLICCKNQDELVKRAGSKECVVLLDEYARFMGTDEFTKWLEKKIHSGVNNVTFCLGAAEGHDPRMRLIGKESISLSPLTMNHQLALLVLAEQLYRAISIMYNEPYHKA